MTEALGLYQEAAKQYNKEVQEKIQNELEEQLLTQLVQCFDS